MGSQQSGRPSWVEIECKLFETCCYDVPAICYQRRTLPGQEGVGATTQHPTLRGCEY